jgi:hypothetical protein
MEISEISNPFSKDQHLLLLRIYSRDLKICIGQ